MRLIEQPTFGKTTYFSLIIANLMPIYGVLFLGWEVFDIIIFYWLETIIIGLFNIIKIAMAEGEAPEGEEEQAKAMGPFFEYLHKKSMEDPNYKPKDYSNEQDLTKAGKLFIIIFFLIHYNFFIFIQFSFITMFISPEGGGSIDPFNISGFAEIIYNNTSYLFVGIIGIILSHAHSLYINYYKGKEYLHTNAGLQMFKPYVRIVIQQFVVIFGGMIALALNAPIILLVLLVGLKIAVDLIAHNFSHRAIYHEKNIS